MQQSDESTVDTWLEQLVVPGLIAGKTAYGRFIFSATGKAAAVKLFTDAVAPVTQIAQANGINPNLIRKWARPAQARKKSKRLAKSVPVGLVPVRVQPVAPSALELMVHIELSKGTLRLALPRMTDLGVIIDQLSGAR
jgi:transposase-like protein